MALAAQQLNRNIERLLQYFLEKQLIGERYGLAGGLEEQEQTGRVALESQRLAGAKLAREETRRNTMDEIFARAKAAVADKPGYTYAESMFNLAQQQKDEPGMRAASEKMAGIMGPYVKFAFKQTTGKDMTEEDLAAGVRGGGVSGLEKGIPEYNKTSQFVQELPIKKKEIKLRGEELEVRRGELTAKGKELEGKLTEQQTATLGIVRNVIEQLRAEGVKPADISQDVRDILGSGKVLNPLSRENSGWAHQYLREIELVLAGGGSLTPAMKRFVTTVVNTSSVEPPTPEGDILSAIPGRPTAGGLANPVTGLMPGEEANAESFVRSNAENLYATKLMQLLGWGEEKRADALALAKKYLAGLK